MFAQNGSEAAALLANPIDRIVELPVLVLNVHSRCNCRCVMCDIWKREGRSELRAVDLQRHRESLRRLAVRWVVLSGGEPLLHSDLGALCAFLRDLNIRLTLLTTGLLLTKRAAEVAEWFDDVVVSLDGPAAIHDAIRRVNGAFHLIQSGVASIHQLRPGMKIADLGCGNCWWNTFAAPVTGVDINEQMLQWARRNQRLADDLSAENALPAGLRRSATEQVHLQGLEIEDGENILDGGRHASGPIFTGEPTANPAAMIIRRFADRCYAAARLRSRNRWQSRVCAS